MASLVMDYYFHTRAFDKMLSLHDQVVHCGLAHGVPDQMSRSRMFGDTPPTTHDSPEAEELPSPRTTIVGGRPPEAGRALPSVPTGVQQLLRLASVDEAFARELVLRRDALAEAAGVALTLTEARMLRAVSAAQLETMIGALPTPAPDRRAFLRQAAAATFVLLGGGLAACERDGRVPVTKGIRPDVPPEPPPAELPAEEPPPERPEHKEMESEGGIAPDVPEPPAPKPAPKSEPEPERPTHSNPTRGIRFDR
jgi:hypothetical protein